MEIRKIMTLCIIYDDNKILLGMKKRGFGAGRWNGFGGKVVEGESIEEAAIREVIEETGITPLDVKGRGIINFYFEDEPTVLEVHLFSASDFQGKLEETDEMKPGWFKLDEIPYVKMWPDDRHWLPLLLEGKNIKGNFHFKDIDTLLRYNLQEQSNS